ncbi:MAG: EF-Tu/IF-2/RF-3 family GTPase [Woeseia sp.]
MRNVVLLSVMLSLYGCSSEEPGAVTRAQPSADVATTAPAVTTSNDEFQMTIADVFNIANSGTVVTGKVVSGTVSKGDSICIDSAKVGQAEIQVAGIEQFSKLLESAGAGENVGLLVTGIEKNNISVGDTLSDDC